VAGVRVGHSTVVDGDGRNSPAIRTGVTAIWPHEEFPWHQRVYAGTSILNGYGEIIGVTAINEWGLLGSPIVLTSSSFIGLAFHAGTRWLSALDPEQGQDDVFMPVVSECDDSFLNDVKAFGLTEEHVVSALESASTGAVQEGSVGSATGLQCFDFKGGIGTASRRVASEQGGYTVGVLVSTNFGSRPDLLIAGVPVGREITDEMPEQHADGSCVVVVATDAPMLPHQLRRLAARAGLGLARTGSIAANGSGELLIAFSTAHRIPRSTADGTIALKALLDGPFWRLPNAFDPIFIATIEATEEAVYNALFQATTMTGYQGHTLHGLPVERALEILRRHGRLRQPVA
jgi:D-aminopeptidase